MMESVKSNPEEVKVLEAAATKLGMDAEWEKVSPQSPQVEMKVEDRGRRQRGD